MNIIIGTVALTGACLTFASIMKLTYNNLSQHSYAKHCDYLFIGFLAVAAICFK